MAWLERGNSVSCQSVRTQVAWHQSLAPVVPGAGPRCPDSAGWMSLMSSRQAVAQWFARQPELDRPDPTNRTRGWRPDSYSIPLRAIPSYAANDHPKTSSLQIHLPRRTRSYTKVVRTQCASRLIRCFTLCSGCKVTG